jgi:hypothetical protein
MYYSFKKSLFALIGLIVLVALLAAFMPRVSRGQGNGPNGPPPFDVKVINSPSEPVPVTGTVSVSNLGADPLPVRDVDNPARKAVRASASCQTSNFNFCDATFFVVPPGKRMVIENVSMEARIPAGLAATMNVSGGWLPLSQPSVNFGLSGSFTRQNEHVRFYVEPGSAVSIQVHRTGPESLQGNFDFRINGYLVDVP